MIRPLHDRRPKSLEQKARLYVITEENCTWELGAYNGGWSCNDGCGSDRDFDIEKFLRKVGRKMGRF